MEKVVKLKMDKEHGGCGALKGISARIDRIKERKEREKERGK